MQASLLFRQAGTNVEERISVASRFSKPTERQILNVGHLPTQGIA